MYDTRREALDLAIRSSDERYSDTGELVARAEAFHNFLTEKEDSK